MLSIFLLRSKTEQKLLFLEQNGAFWLKVQIPDLMAEQNAVFSVQSGANFCGA